MGGAIIAEIANGSYQWFDLNQPGNESKGWDYWGSASAGITGALAPGRGVWKNVGIAAGGAVFTDGPDVGAVGGAALGALAGGFFCSLPSRIPTTPITSAPIPPNVILLS